MRELTSAFGDPGKEAIGESVNAKGDYVVSDIDQELMPSLRHIVLYTVSRGTDLFCEPAHTSL